MAAGQEVEATVREAAGRGWEAAVGLGWAAAAARAGAAAAQVEVVSGGCRRFEGVSPAREMACPCALPVRHGTTASTHARNTHLGGGDCRGGGGLGLQCHSAGMPARVRGSHKTDSRCQATQCTTATQQCRSAAGSYLGGTGTGGAGLGGGSGGGGLGLQRQRK